MASSVSEKELTSGYLTAAGTRPLLTSLADSLNPLQQHFNRHGNKMRFLALLSPTCPECVFGAGAIKTAIIDSFPQAQISLSIVWINMLREDSEATAKIAAQIIIDPRALHFHDPQRSAGRAVAQALGDEGKVAWDTYLFYAPGQDWQGSPPRPVAWMHQLTRSPWADPEHFRFGSDLVAGLGEAAKRLQEIFQPIPKNPSDLARREE